MEGLTLENLQDFTVTPDDNEVFDAFSAKPGEGDKEDKGIETPADPRDEAKSAEEAKEIKTPGSEESKTPESVANEGKDNQGQAGKATDAKEGSNSSSPNPNDSEQLYSKLAAQFVQEGVLPDLDPNEVKSLADINNALTAQAEKRLTDQQAVINEAIKAGAPVNEVAEAYQVVEQLKAFTDEDITSETGGALRKNLIAQDFVNKGYEADRAQLMAQRSIDAGTGVEDAKFALAAIIKSEEGRYKGLIQSSKDAEVKILTDIKDTLQKQGEVLPGIKLTTEQGNEIYTAMTTDVGGGHNAFIQAQRADKVGMRVKTEAIFHLTKGYTDFSIFGVAASTETAGEIENLLRGTNFTADGKVITDSKDNQSTFTLKDVENLTFGE